MEDLKKLEKLIEKIGNESGRNIPGLNTDAIIIALSKKNLQLQLAIQEAENINEKDEILNRFKNTYKSYIDEQISIIKVSYSEINEGIKNIQNSIGSAIKTTLIPPALGVPPPTPNPLWALEENKQKIAMLESQLTSLNKSFLIMLQAAKNIEFSLPDSILGILNQILNIKNLLKKIPS